ncbi:MAG: LysM peptidoglycan-binding domain-containing protein [Gammaproteobacteria bacterium]|nr:LysM peptidoglycan-binding domain-containing protein [Gammaproteobacteria bacterium]MDH3450126.1 LysM peptidoglycan-binding domain-containing protein [Gammaproteobacteria bacterium]
MPNDNNRQLTKGLILLSGMLLLAACAEPPPPYAVIHEPEPAPEIITVEAQIPEARPLPEETIVYEPEFPETYIVQEGDTLWDISTVFLRDPWYWPEIWFKNPQVENPHLIYPGDTLAIVYVGGERRVQILSRGADGSVLSQTTDGLKIVKVNPRVRSRAIDASIPSIPIDSIRHLLQRPIVVDDDTLQNSAYVLSSLDNHLINSINDKLYVRKLDTSSGSGRYQIYRPSRPIYDPITNELLGYEALYVGESKLLLRGDPASVRVTNSEREILRDDRVMPMDNTNFERDFFPKPPSTEVNGSIVALLDAISQTGLYQTIAINLGQRDGIESGNLLRIVRTGAIIPDKAEIDPDFRVKLPDEQIGMAMVVRSFEKMSFALIMEANVPITINDYVESP